MFRTRVPFDWLDTGRFPIGRTRRSRAQAGENVFWRLAKLLSADFGDELHVNQTPLESTTAF